MDKALQIVNTLLEADIQDNSDIPPGPLAPDEAQHYVDQLINDEHLDKTTGRITRKTAETAGHFWHRTKTNSKGQSYEARRMGKTKTWAKQPDKFRIPVKFGMYDSFYIDNDNANEWSTIPVEPKPKIKKPQ